MTDTGLPPAPEGPELGQPVEQPQQPAFDRDEALGAYQGQQIRAEYDQALADGNEEEVSFLTGYQARQAARSNIRLMMEGKDPAFQTKGMASFIPPFLESARRGMWISERERATNAVVDGEGWAMVDDWWKTSVMEPYKAKNDPELGRIVPGMSDEELLEIQGRLEPMTLDPNEVAEMRSAIVEMDKQIQEASGGMYTVWNHPKTRRIAQYINRETAIGTPGFFRSGEQELPAFTQYVAQPAVAGLEAVTDPVAKLVFGGAGMIGQALDGLTGGAVGWSAPTNFIETEDGTILSNAGDIPGLTDMFVGIHAHLTRQSVAHAMAGYDAAKEHAWANSNGFGHLVTGVSTVAGALAGFAPTAAAGVQASKLMNKGLAWTGALGKVSAGAQASARARSIMLLTGAAGQAGSFGIQEGISTGDPDKFLSGMGHGAMTGLVMHVIGQMGKGVETLARRRNMPGRIAQGLGLTTEALGFTGAEIADMEGSLWEFIKSPDAETWDEYVMAFTKNWLGILIGKGMGAQLGTGPTKGQLGRLTETMIESAGQRLQGMRQRGEKAPREMTEQIKEMGTTPEALETYAMEREAARRGDVGAARRSAEQLRTIRAERAGVGRSATEEAEAAVTEATKQAEVGIRAPLPSERAELQKELGEAMRKMTEVQGEEFNRLQTRIEEITERLEAPEVLEAGGELGSLVAERAHLEAPAVEGAATARRQDIFDSMQGFEGDPIRTPQRKGKIAGTPGVSPSAKGFLNRNQNLIRYKGETELAERAHEFSHAAQDAAVGIAGQALPTAARVEAAKMLEGYRLPKKPTTDLIFAESWAEYFARDLLGENMGSQFPELTKVFKPLMAARKPVLDQYQRTKELFQRNRDIGEYGRAEAQVYFTEDPVSPEARQAMKAGEGNFPRRMVRKVSELMFRDIEGLQYKAEKWGKIAGVDVSQLPIHLHVVKTMETLRAKEDARTSAMVTDGIIRRRPDGEMRAGPSLKEALNVVRTTEQRRAFAVGLVEYKHWVMSKKGHQTYTGGNQAIHARNVQLAAAKVGMTLKEFARTMRKTKGFFDDLIQWTADEGLVSREDAQKMVDEWNVYVPFQRYVSGALRSGIGTGAGLRGIKRGGTEAVADPFEAMVQVTRGIVRQVHRHRATEALYQMGKKLKGMGGLVTEIPADQIPQELKLNELVKAMEKQIHLEGDRQQDFEFGLETMKEALGEEAGVSMMLFRQALQPGGNKPVVVHRTPEGKRVWLELDKGAYEALQTVEGNYGTAGRAMAALQGFTGAVRAPAALVRYFATGVSLSFATRNMFRDAAMFPGYSSVNRSMLPFVGIAYWARGVSRLLASSQPEGPVGKVAQKVAQVFSGTGFAKIAAHYRQGGGEGFSYYAQEVGRKRGADQLFNKEAHTPRGMIEKTRTIIDKTLGKVIDVGERALRFEEYTEVFKKALKEGRPEEMAAIEALEASQEVTINFTRAGILGRELNKIVPYFNAGMQGQRKAFRAFLGMDGQKAARMAWTNLASTAGTLTALQYLFNKDEDWFKDLQPWQRFYAWHFDLGGEKIQIPIPHLAGAGAVSVMDQLLSENKMEPGDILGEAMDQLVWDHFTVPSFMLPIVEWKANYSFWRERPIVPEWMERSRIGPEQFDEYTKGWSKWASRVMFDQFGVEFSPMKLQNAVNGALGGLPNNMERTISGLGNAMGFEVNKEQDDALDQIPVLSSLFRHYEHKGGRAVNEFWEEKGDLDRLGDEADQSRRSWSNRIAERLRSIDRLRRAGMMDKEEAARAKYEVALPFVEQGK